MFVQVDQHGPKGILVTQKLFGESPMEIEPTIKMILRRTGEL